MWRSFEDTLRTRKIERRIRALRSRGERALAAYVMSGYPTAQGTLSIVRGVVRGGADIVELGHPFSDPMADGLVIQGAASASLRGGTTLSGTLDLVRSIREEFDVPLALMTYANIPYRYKYPRFAAEIARAGANGCILPDMSVEEAGWYMEAMREHDVEAIFLVSPNTGSPRVRMIAEMCSGFLYMVAVYGTTGTRRRVSGYAIDAIKRMKRVIGDVIPLGVGFGVSSSGDVRQYIDAGADAVIVGSAILELVARTPRDELEDTVAAFVSSLKEATRL